MRSGDRGTATLSGPGPALSTLRVPAPGNSVGTGAGAHESSGSAERWSSSPAIRDGVVVTGCSTMSTGEGPHAARARPAASGTAARAARRAYPRPGRRRRTGTETVMGQQPRRWARGDRSHRGGHASRERSEHPGPRCG